MTVLGRASLCSLARPLRVSASRRPGQRGAERPRSGAAGALDAAGREPIIAGRGPGAVPVELGPGFSCWCLPFAGTGVAVSWPGRGTARRQPGLPRPAGAACRARDMMIYWVPSRGGGLRPLILSRPSALAPAVGRAADSGLAGAGRGGPIGCGSALARLAAVTGHGGPGCRSAGAERVVAEPGQDVARLADDLAGLGESGALAVLAVLDLRVVGVVGGAGAGVGLAGLIDAQRSTAGPCRDSCPGERLPSEE